MAYRSRSRCGVLLAAVWTAVLTTPVVAQWAGLQPGDKYHLLFVTSGLKGITSNDSVPPITPLAFGGTAAADWVVSFDAWAAGLPGMAGWDFVNPRYRALLSDSGDGRNLPGGASYDVIDWLDVQGPVFNPNGVRIADNKADMFDGSINIAVNIDENGSFAAGDIGVWTGSTAAGVWSGSSCDDWKTNSSGQLGETGRTNTNNSSWVGFTQRSCDQLARLFGISPALPVLHRGDFNGDGEADGADFLQWQRDGNQSGGSGGDDDAVNLADWQSHYGKLVDDNSRVDPYATGATDVWEVTDGNAEQLTGLLVNSLGTPPPPYNRPNSEMVIGNTSSGAVRAAGQASFNTESITIGKEVGADGALTIVDDAAHWNAGVQTTWTTVSDVTVGVNGGGQLNVSAGGKLEAGGTLLVGESGTGTLTLETEDRIYTSQIMVGNNLQLGVLSGGEGTMTFNGGIIETGLTPSANGGDFVVGQGGSGTYHQHGGSLRVGDDFVLGNFATSTATATVTGGGISTGNTAATDTHMYVGLHGQATFEQSGGSVLSVDHLYIAHEAGATGTVNLTGGRFSVDLVFIKQNNAVGTATGALNISGDASLRLHHVLGTMLVENGGSVSLSGGSLETPVLDVEDGEFSFTGGELRLAEFRAPSGILRQEGGTLIPFSSGGESNLQINADYELVAGTLRSFIDNVGELTTIFANGYDVALSGGDLEIQFLSSSRPQLGETFDLLEAASITGDFATIIASDMGTLAFEASIVTVDPGPATPLQKLVLTVVPAPAGILAEVPEPASLLLLIAGAVMCSSIRFAR